MKRLIALVMLMLLLPALACAQGLDAGLEQALGQVDLAPLETAAREDNLRVYLLRLAKGEMIWDARQVLDTLLRRLYGEARSSFSRMMGLLAPALLASAAGLLGGKRKDVIRIAESACFLALAATIAADMQLYMHEAEQTVSRMAEMMQALFPILLTLLAAVGGSHGAALLEPAVSAASGIVTALVRGVSLRLSTGVAVVTLLDHLSPRMRLSRLAGLLAHGLQLAAGRGLYGFPGGNVIAGADGLCGGRHKHPRSQIRGGQLCAGCGWYVCRHHGYAGGLLAADQKRGGRNGASAAAFSRGGAHDPHAVRGDDLSALRRAFAACFAVQGGRSFAGFFGCVDAVVYHSAIGQRHVCTAGGAGVGGGQRHGGAKIK